MISNESLTLRPLSLEDTQFILELRNDLEMSSNMFSDPPIYDFAHIEWLKNTRNSIDLIIIENATADRIGRVSLTNIDFRHQKAEFGIIIKKDMQSIGYGESASRMLIDYVFENLPIRKLYLHLFSDNLPAQKLYEKLGFVNEGKFISEYYKNGNWKDVTRMALIK